MKIVLRGENALTLVPTGDALTIESPAGEEPFSPFHMLGAALASCTLSVLYSWASHAGLDADRLRLHVEWEFGEQPYRLARIRVIVQWPDLPEPRRAAAERAAALCTIHATLTHPTQVDTVLDTAEAEDLP